MKINKTSFTTRGRWNPCSTYVNSELLGIALTCFSSFNYIPKVSDEDTPFLPRIYK